MQGHEELLIKAAIAVVAFLIFGINGWKHYS